MLVKVALVQHEVGSSIGLDLKLHLFRKRPDIICFPEYWAAVRGMAGPADLAHTWGRQQAVLSRLSRELCCTVIGGTGVWADAGGLYNASPVFEAGVPRGVYRKQHPTDRESASGIRPGSGHQVWTVGPVRVAVAICADCLHPEVFDSYAACAVDLIFVPNASPYRPHETVLDKFERDEAIFVAGAQRAGAYLIKVCGVGSLFGGVLQGRSLIASPWGVLNRVAPGDEARVQVVTANLSVDELHEFRARLARTDVGSPAAR